MIGCAINNNYVKQLFILLEKNIDYFPNFPRKDKQPTQPSVKLTKEMWVTSVRQGP